MSSARLSKEAYHYRRGEKLKPCSLCGNSKHMQILGIGRADLGVQWRCILIGTDASARYRIHEDGTCDNFNWKEEFAHGNQN